MDDNNQTEQKPGDETKNTPSPESDAANPDHPNEQTKDKLNVLILQESSPLPPSTISVSGLMHYSWPYLILFTLGLAALVFMVSLNPLHDKGLDHPGAGIYVISMVMMVIFCSSAVLYLLHQILQTFNEHRRMLHERELEEAARNERNEIRALSTTATIKKTEDTSSKEDKLVKLFKEMVELAATLKVEQLSEETGNKLLVVNNLPGQVQQKLETLLLEIFNEKNAKI